MWSANDPCTFEGDIGNSSSGQTYTAVFNPTTLASTEVLVTNTGDDMFCPGTANLFDGSILVNGGDSSPKTTLYNWQTGLWTSAANMNIPRGYEANTVLANGQVMTLGGSWSGGQGGPGCSANHFNTEIFTPPYLLNANGTAATRPVISSAPTTAALGTNIAVTTSGPVQSFVMMRLSSTTHTVNNDQRRVPLTPVSSSGNTYTLTIPSNSGIALQGYYWIFALNAQGVPSVGSTILIN
jgi:hypothetical protein